MRCIVIGASAGGLRALKIVLKDLKLSGDTFMIIIQHLGKQTRLDKIISNYAEDKVVEIQANMKAKAKTIFVAPADYHVFMERDLMFSLSLEEKVNYSRPSIDVLFESLAEVFLDNLLAILLTGASSDGSMGLKRIKGLGGKTIIQNSETAEYKKMPEAALSIMEPDYIYNLEEINSFLEVYLNE